MIKIKILLVDDQALFREGLKTLLSVQPEFDVVGEAENGDEAVRQAIKNKPDVILMDLRMPGMDGATATRRIHSSLPESKVIILTTFDDDEAVFEGLRAGAIGYLLKDVSSQKLIEAIRAASRGESFLQPSIASKVLAEFSRLSSQFAHPSSPVQNPLSEREQEILCLVATGASNKEIATKLVIAEGTVKNHLTNILAKLEVQDRIQAVFKGKELGLL